MLDKESQSNTIFLAGRGSSIDFILRLDRMTVTLCVLGTLQIRSVI